MKTRASSCSSASASTSSSVDSSGDDEPEDSSVTESSPSKPNGHRSQNRRVLPTNARKKSEASKQNMKKASVIRNLANEMLSSADEGDLKDDGKLKKKQPHQRRPLTRRQKSGVKKTIPTTTLFNQRYVNQQLISLGFIILIIIFFTVYYSRQRLGIVRVVPVQRKRQLQ
jgi:hypothetical protein